MHPLVNLVFLHSPVILAGVFALVMFGSAPAVDRAQNTAQSGQASDPDDDPKDEEDKESQQGGGEEPKKSQGGRKKLQIDPELQRRIDKLMESHEGQQAPTGQKEPGARRAPARKRPTPKAQRPSTRAKGPQPRPA